MAFAPTPEHQAAIDELLRQYPTRRAACIPILHLCQKQEGWVSPEVIAYTAELVGISTAAVKGVATFYTSLFQKPVAPNVVWVCRTLSCELRGAKDIQDHLERRLGCHVGETSSDGMFTLLKAECLAACGYGPMVQINDAYHEHLTLEKLDLIIDEARQRSAAAASETRDVGVSSPHPGGELR